MESWSIGIDFGTTFCFMAFWSKDKIMPIQISGKRSFPAMVSYFEKENTITCGYVAQAQLSNKEKTVIYDSKRYMGKRWDEIDKDDIKKYPFDIVENDGMVGYKLIHNNSEKILSPIDILSELLKYIQLSASPHITSDPPDYKIKDVVITIPSYFKDLEKDGIRKSSEKAGLHVLELLPEPAAAVFPYIHNNIIKNEILLVYDFGGSSFDVSVIKIKDNNITILGSGRDGDLGGEDITNNIIEYVVNKIKNDYNYDLRINAKKICKLRKEIDEAKINLSITTEAEISVKVPGEEDEIAITITRNLYDQLNQRIFEKTIEIVKSTLSDMKIPFNDVKDIVLAGGSSKIPKVRELLTNNFTNAQTHKDFDEEEVIASGAAIYANLVKTGDNPYKVIMK